MSSCRKKSGKRKALYQHGALGAAPSSWVLPVAQAPLGLSFPSIPMQPCPNSQVLYGSEIHRDWYRWETGPWGGETRARRVPDAPPSVKTDRVPGASPPASNSPGLQLFVCSDPPPLPAQPQRLRNHLSLDPRGRQRRGRRPHPASCPWPSDSPSPPSQSTSPPSIRLLFPLLGRGRGKR